MEQELESLALTEAERLRSYLDGLNPLLERLVDAAAIAPARRILADRTWSDEGCKPDSPWLKVSRDALRRFAFCWSRATVPVTWGAAMLLPASGAFLRFS